MSGAQMCKYFKPSLVNPIVCAWWESEVDEPGIAYFCSRPSWEGLLCETRGLRSMPRADDEEDSFE